MQGGNENDDNEMYHTMCWKLVSNGDLKVLHFEFVTQTVFGAVWGADSGSISGVRRELVHTSSLPIWGVQGREKVAIAHSHGREESIGGRTVSVGGAVAAQKGTVWKPSRNIYSGLQCPIHKKVSAG